MMADRATLARPYARAAFRMAGNDERPSWGRLMAMLGALAADPRMIRLLHDPRVSATRLAGMIRELCGERVENERQARFIDLLVHAGRMEYAPQIERQFAGLRHRAERTTAARVVSARPLDAEGRGRITRLLEQHLGSQVELSVAEDRSLLGGLRIHLGDQVIDASIRGRLHRLADTLHVYA